MTLPRLPALLIILLLVLTPVGAQETTNQPLGLETFARSPHLGINHISGIDIPYDEDRYRRALELGAGWNRWALYWHAVETADSEFAWESYDELVSADLDAGLQINAVLLGIPQFHRNGETIQDLYAPIFSDGTDEPGTGKPINPENPFARFVYAAVTRYMPGGTLARERRWQQERGIRVWEVWNEPDFEPFWSGGVDDYTRMLKVAYLVIKQTDPNAMVMFGGLLYPTHRNWLAEVMRVIASDPMHETHNWYFDAVGVHSYTDAWRSGWLTLYVRQTMIEFGIMRPIWLNESGATVWDDYPGATWLADRPRARANSVTLEEAANLFVQGAAWAFAEGAEVVFYFQLHDDCGNQPAGTDFPPNAEALCEGNQPCSGEAFGIYPNPPGAVCFSHHPHASSARPVAAAYQLVRDVFGTVPFSRRGVVDTRDYEGVVTITFSRPQTDERIVVLWNITHHPITLNYSAFDNQAELYSLDGIERIQANAGSYTLHLEPSETDRVPPDDGIIPNGGAPLILIEHLQRTESVNLQVLTYVRPPSDAIAPTPTPIPQVRITSEELYARVSASPTGAIFTAVEYVRLRTAPSTETGSVVGQLTPNASAPILGILTDGSWVQLETSNGTVWAAAFLGVIQGDTSHIPVLAPPPEPTDTP